MVDAFNYILLINQDETTFDLGRYIDRDSVSMSVAPRVTRSITTLDGREHVSSFGQRQSLTFTFNPLTYADATNIVTKMITAAAFKVSFRSLMPSDSNDGYFDMKLDEMSAEYLSRCKLGNANFYQFDAITLVQL